MTPVSAIRDDLAGWRGDFPVALIRPVANVVARRAALRDFAAAIRGEATIVVEHREGRRPRIVPPDPGLSLSTASRDGLAAFAAARCPVGIDVERIEPEAAVPFGVLHPAERAALDRRSQAQRGADFAALWASKEAYLKALGLGLMREPASVRVTLRPGGAEIRDGAGKASALVTRHCWRESDYVVALVVLPDQPTIGSASTA